MRSSCARSTSLVRDQTLSDAVNLAVLNSVPNSSFVRELRAAWGTPVGIPSPAWLLDIGARAMGTETELVLKSRRAVPGKLMEHGFTYTFPDWSSAARDLCARSTLTCERSCDV